MSQPLWFELAADLDELRSTGRSRATVETMRLALERWLEFCRRQGLARPTQVQTAHVARYHSLLQRMPGLHGQPLSDSTVKLWLRAVRSLFRWALARQHLLVDPNRRPGGGQGPHPVPCVFDGGGGGAVALDAAPAHPAGPARSSRAGDALQRGAAHQEARSLNLGDIDLGARTLFVNRGKGGRDRVLPLGEVLAEVLEAYLLRGRPQLVGVDADPEALFLTRFGTRLCTVMLGQMVRRYALLAGLRPPFPTPHTFRHACATHLLEGGADLLQIQVFLGHATVQSTQRYTHLFPLDLLNEHRRTHPRARRHLER